MSTIKIKNLTFGFDQQQKLIFEDAALNIDTKWKLGLIGRNGRGKTTFLQLLLGKYPYIGNIEHQQIFTYFPQTVANPDELTYYVLQELSDFEQWKIERELTLLKIEEAVLWRPFATLSGGEQTKVLLALLFADEQNFPLIDEPTNHLDITAREHVASYLKEKRQGFIVVSHDRKFVNEVVDHVLSIEKSRLILYQGNFAVYEEQKRLRDDFEREQNQKLKKEVSRLKQTASEKAEWSRSREGDKTKKRKGFIDTDARRADKGAIGADAARAMKRSKAIVKRMEEQAGEKEKLLKDIEYIEPLVMNAITSHHQELLAVENLQLSFDQPLFQPLSFKIEKQQRIALIGPNGSGKSSILRYLLGEFTGSISGTLRKPQNLKISYVRQNYEDNRGTLKEFAQKQQIVYQELLNNLNKLGVERSVFQLPIEQMSMGQRKRVELAKSLATPAELFIWDEPLNYLDVFNQQQLEEVINLVQPAMLIVEHDPVFLENTATEIVSLSKKN